MNFWNGISDFFALGFGPFLADIEITSVYWGTSFKEGLVWRGTWKDIFVRDLDYH